MRPQRIQLRRTKGWRLPPNTIVVSRPSKFGNPFVVGHVQDDILTMSRVHAVCRFREFLTGYSPEADVMRSGLGELRGKNLACWCPLGSCHADVLLELANT